MNTDMVYDKINSKKTDKGQFIIFQSCLIICKNLQEFAEN